VIFTYDVNSNKADCNSLSFLSLVAFNYSVVT